MLGRSVKYPCTCWQGVAFWQALSSQNICWPFVDCTEAIQSLNFVPLSQVLRSVHHRSKQVLSGFRLNMSDNCTKKKSVLKAAISVVQTCTSKIFFC